MNQESLSSTLYRDNDFTDLIIVVSGKEFHVHRAALGVSSVYFRTLLKSGFSESQKNKFPLNRDPSTFEGVIRAIYDQNPFGDDFETNLRVARELIYFQVEKFNPVSYLKSWKVPVEFYADYLLFVNELFPDGIPEYIIDILASKISPGVPGTGPSSAGVDLIQLSDEMIIALLSSPEFKVQNLYWIYELVNDLVSKGHSPELYALFNYNHFPEAFKDSLPAGHVTKYNRGGPIPRLGTVSLWHTSVKLLTIDMQGYQYKFMDGSGKIWNAGFNFSKPTLQPGDIILAVINGIKRVKASATSWTHVDATANDGTYLNIFGWVPA